MREDYWEESVQPLTCLLFVAPLLLLYEAGIIWMGPEALRNGADLWLREALGSLGFGQYLFLPTITCGLLLGWHHVTRRKWSFRSEVLSGMVCESMLLGICVVIFAYAFAIMTEQQFSYAENATALGASAKIPSILSFLGAGIYEELLFRLLLLQGMILFCQRCGTTFRSAVLLAVLSSSLLFASAHYRLFFGVGVEFSWDSFFFRFAAGSLFSMLFLVRGFGIAVGTHAVYDILVCTLS